jgi:hypothetical protein
MGDMEFKIAFIRRQELKKEILEAKIQKHRKGIPPRPLALNGLPSASLSNPVLPTLQKANLQRPPALILPGLPKSNNPPPPPDIVP